VGPALALGLALLALGGQTGSAAAQSSREVIAAVQVHGNTVTSDEEIRRMAGVDAGSVAAEDVVEAVTARLVATKRFESVRVLKRFASITDPSQILIVIIVDEGAVRIERTGDPENPTRVVRSRRSALMFLPILNFEDGYGFTYGARFAWPDPAGKQSRLSVPASWGGDKRVALEFEKSFDSGPISRISAGGSLSRRTNPFYEIDDNRGRVWFRGERNVTGWLKAGGTVSVQRDAFAGTTDDFGSFGADLSVDTRLDPLLPRNAVFARAAWDHVAGADRTELDARGYIGALGQSVIALRALRMGSNRPLPPYLKPLLGGMANLRGFEAGIDAADNVLTGSAELIVPLTSPLRFGRAGVSAFADVGTAYDDGERLADQALKQGFGGSVWFSAAFFRMNLAVAHGRGASTRVHVGATVAF